MTLKLPFKLPDLDKTRRTLVERDHPRPAYADERHTAIKPQVVEPPRVVEMLAIEELSIDSMCGVY